MGNTISFNENVQKEDDSLSISNGLTDVLIDVLLLSGSNLAITESEKRMMVFLAEKQQIVVGLGTVGFEIVQMPWERKTFEADKKFMLETIKGARQKIGWEKLDYTPSIEYITYALDGFESLIKRMRIEDVNEEELKEWMSEAEANDPIHMGYPKCEKHDIILSIFGCKLCNETK